MGTLDNRVALVTGAAGGLGTTICDVFRSEGADVVPVDLKGEGCFEADVASRDGNVAMVDEAIRRHGRLDTLILNAGIQHMAPIDEFPESEWDRLFGVMVKGPFFAIQAAWPHLTAQPGGRIVATASVLSFIAEEYKAAYVSAKHAVLGLVKVAALEGLPHGLCANAVAPGLMWTSLMENQLEDHMRLRSLTREQVVERIMMYQPGRATETVEVADVIAFLASDKASSVTGTCIPIDLGVLAT